MDDLQSVKDKLDSTLDNLHSLCDAVSQIIDGQNNRNEDDEAKTSDNMVVTPQPNEKIRSMTFVDPLFKALNENIFNNALKGITLKLSEDLKLRTAASWVHSSRFQKHTEISLSKSLLSKCTNKQIMESLLYEMVYLHILTKLPKTNSDDAEKSKYLQALFKRAMTFLNATYGTNLSFNYPFRAHKTTESFDEWVDLIDGLNIQNFNDTVVCLSDDSDDDCDAVIVVDNTNKTNDSVQLLTVKIVVQNLEESGELCSVCCCCVNYNNEFKESFNGTNINLPSNGPPPAKKCPACCEVINIGNLANHCQNACNVFRA